MAEYLIKEETLTGIADAIREKTGITGKVSVADMGFQVLGLYGENNVENVTVEPDFSEGDYVVEPSAEGKVLGQVTVAKPEALIPENIAEGIDIAGIIGTFAADDGGKVSVKFGYTSTSGTIRTVTHGLGVTPDIVVVWPTTAFTGSYVDFILGVSAAGRDNFGWSDTHARMMQWSLANSTGISSVAQLMTAQTDGYVINSANPTTFTIGCSSSKLYSSATYYWIAIGGLT